MKTLTHDQHVHENFKHRKMGFTTRTETVIDGGYNLVERYNIETKKLSESYRYKPEW